MPYVFRDAQGNVTGTALLAQFQGQEHVDGDVTLWKSPMQELAEADAPFTPRRVREFMRAVLEDKAAEVAEKLGVELAVVLAANPAYQLVKTYDDMAAQARAKL